MTVKQMDVLHEDFDRDLILKTHIHTQACAHIKSVTHAEKTCTHAYAQLYRQAGVAECEQVV